MTFVRPLIQETLIPHPTLVQKSGNPLPPKPEDDSIIGGLWKAAHRSLRTLLAIEDQAEKNLEGYKKSFQNWLLWTSFHVLSLFMSMMFLILGLFFIAVDYGHIPRGFVLIGGGLLGFLILRFSKPGWNKSIKQKTFFTTKAPRAPRTNKD